MRIKSLAQGENILMLGIEPSTFVSKIDILTTTPIDWVIVRPDDDIHKKSTVTDSLESDHYCTISYFNVTVSKPSTLCRTVRNIVNIDRPSFIAEVSCVSEFSSVEEANQFCDFLRTVLDKHPPPSLRKVITHNSSPWLESIREELFIATRKRRQAER